MLGRATGGSSARKRKLRRLSLAPKPNQTDELERAGIEQALLGEVGIDPVHLRAQLATDDLDLVA